MWTGQFWGPLQGALSQFIDIQAFDPLTTGMSLGLSQPCLSALCWPEKPGVPPRPSAPLCMVVMVSKWVQQHYVTLMWALSHFLPFLLFFPWLSMLFHCRACQRGLSVRWQCPACHRHPYTYTVQRRAGSENSRASIPITHSNRNCTFSLCCESCLWVLPAASLRQFITRCNDVMCIITTSIVSFVKSISVDQWWATTF